jgi:hypothetical protein
MTECTQTSFGFASHPSREVVARFDGGTITTEAGGLLLHKVEQKTGILRQFASCFRDYRDPNHGGTGTATGVWVGLGPRRSQRS